MLLTQTNWFRMPARELRSSFASPNETQGAGTTRLKRHKTLPHPRKTRLPDKHASTPSNQDGGLATITGAPITRSDNFQGLMKRASGDSGVNGLPPTPPTHSRQSSGSHTLHQSEPIPSSGFQVVPSTPNTPLHQRSPPTPDVTPPRMPPLAFRPLTDSYASPRTESFKTAREDPYSSDEDGVSTLRQNLRKTRNPGIEALNTSQPAPKQRDLGLNLGLESENERTTTPRLTALDTLRAELGVFDGEWRLLKDDYCEIMSEWDPNLMRNVTVRKMRGQTKPNSVFFRNHPEVIKNEWISPTQATKIVRSFHLDENTTLQSVVSDQVDSTPKVEKSKYHPALPASLPTSGQDVRRMPSHPYASTSVEAIVLDKRPLQRQTLRHTKKQLGLRSISDPPTTNYAPDSVDSLEPQHLHRLHCSAAKIMGQKNRSAASTRTISTTSSTKSRRDVIQSGGIPVVVIPERISSTKSCKPRSLRSTSSRKTKRSRSLSSAAHSSAPLSQSSKFNHLGCCDGRSTRGRTVSESAKSGISIRTSDYYTPVIPIRRSSLSVQKSHDRSRSGSLTAESLKVHDQLEARKPQSLSTPRFTDVPLQIKPVKDSDGILHRVNLEFNGDPFFGTRPSTQFTPFSQGSCETAGTTAEVSEALAVSLFPHQNKSVLVVQHSLPSEQTHTPFKSSHTGTTVSDVQSNGIQLAPVTPQTSNAVDEVDSPLKNPRPPPDPPAIKFIPPTPAGTEEGQQLDNEVEDEVESILDDSPAGRTTSLMRRFSTRRPSEPAQSSSFIRRTFSLGSRRKNHSESSTQNSKSEATRFPLRSSSCDIPADRSMLHPFWRPSNFWDDLEDEEDWEDSYSQNNNRLAPPKRSVSERFKRSIGISPADESKEHYMHPMDRRTLVRSPGGHNRVVKQRSQSSPRTVLSRRDLLGDVRPSTEGGERHWGYGFKQGNGVRVRTVTGFGLQIGYVGWSGLRRWASEKRRERRRESLRGIIGAPKAVKSGVDDVLRASRSTSQLGRV